MNLEAAVKYTGPIHWFSRGSFAGLSSAKGAFKRIPAKDLVNLCSDPGGPTEPPL